MPGTNQPQHGIQGLSAKLQEFARRLTSLESWQRTMSVPASPWAAPALINSWGNVGSGFETAGYLKDPLGFVRLKGLIVGGATGSVAFVLPVGFRPGAKAQYTLSPGGGIAVVIIDTGGNVAITYTASADMSFAGITFLAEN